MAKKCDDQFCPFHGKTKLHGRMMVGTVVSDKADKTVTVERIRRHFLKKYDRYEKRGPSICLNSPIYLLSCRICRTFTIIFELGLTTILNLPFICAVYRFDIKFANGSFMLILHHLYFLKPIFVAISLKQCLHRLSPYLPTCPPTRLHRLHRFVASPCFLSFGLLCLMNFFIFAGFACSCLNIFL